MTIKPADWKSWSIAVGSAVLFVTCLPKQAHAQIRTSHPRIYITEDNLRSMQARWAGKADSELGSPGSSRSRLRTALSLEADRSRRIVVRREFAFVSKPQ